MMVCIQISEMNVFLFEVAPTFVSSNGWLGFSASRASIAHVWPWVQIRVPKGAHISFGYLTVILGMETIHFVG